jgi:hypothetical protein
MDLIKISRAIFPLFAIIVAIAGCGVPQGELREIPQDELSELPKKTQDQFNAALTVVRSLAAGDFEHATEKFDAVTKTSWPPEKLEETWRDLEARFGEFDSQTYLGDSDRGEEDDEAAVVYVSCKFKNGGCTVWVSLNSGNLISSIEFEDGQKVPVEEMVSDAPAEHLEAALGVIRTIAAGNFESVFENFSAEQKDFLPLEKLKKKWNYLETQHGALEDIRVFSGQLFHYESRRSESLVIIQCTFKRGESAIMVSIDIDDQISGVTFADPAL